jgi:dihydrofolate reductase
MTWPARSESPARVRELTQVHADVVGDATVPAPDPAVWREVNREWHPAEGDTPAYTFVTLERR